MPASALVPVTAPNYTATARGTVNSIIPGTTDIGNHCDDCVSAVTLPFAVNFYGTSYTSGQASSNGNFQFTNLGSDTTDYSNTCLPTAVITDTIFAYWDDLRTDGTTTGVGGGPPNGIFTATTGTAPNRQFVMEWRADFYDYAGETNFEIVFTEGSPTISVIYGASSGAGANGGSATSGVQRGTGSAQFTQYSCDATAPALLTSGKRVDYTIPEPLTVTKSGNGTGTVTSSPTGITCGATCNANFDSSTVVTLTPTPDSGMAFTGWGGACSGTGACQVTMNSAQSVSATFIRAPKSLTVTKTGAGTGTVTSSPAGINCGSTCTASFADGSAVILTATADAGKAFAGWSGACTGTGPCQVTMSANQSVSASFTVVPVLPKAGFHAPVSAPSRTVALLLLVATAVLLVLVGASLPRSKQL